MSWSIKGEMVVNCNCSVFCPCVISLGKHPPTDGYCQAWLGLHIKDGVVEGADVSGLNVGLLLDVPGLMSSGGYTLAGYIDERADDETFDSLVKVFRGELGGSTFLFRLLVSNHLGFERAPIEYITDGKKRRLKVGKQILGEVEPIAGKDPSEPVVIKNSEYWPSSDITVAKANYGKVRAFGRAWDFDGLSAEIVRINWQG